MYDFIFNIFKYLYIYKIYFILNYIIKIILKKLIIEKKKKKKQIYIYNIYIY